MSSSLRNINRRIATNIVNWAGVPTKQRVLRQIRCPIPQKRVELVTEHLSLRQRMLLLTMKLADQRKKAVEKLEANTAESLRDLVESEDLTPEALQARKDADEDAEVEVSPAEGQ